MSKGTGKKFENDIKSSVPHYCDFERFKDAGYDLSDQRKDGFQNSKRRFTPKNLCDCLIFDGERGKLHYVELKSRKGKSIAFKDVDKDGKFLKKMIQKEQKKNVKAWIIINFRVEPERTFAIKASDVREYIMSQRIEKGRKSLPMSYCEEHAIEIPQYLKRTRYWYDLEPMLGG